MYLPSDFAPDDPAVAWRIIEDHPFGILFDPSEPSATHIPFLVKRDGEGRPVGLRGHVARANPVASVVGGGAVMAVFRGPHAYVTPTWYAQPREQVPTWNYVVAHAWGRAELLDRAGARALLADLCARFEPPGGFRADWLPSALLDELLDHIVAFEIAVERVQAKLKLSQNRSPEDRRRVLAGLEARGGEGDQAVADWMRRVLGDG